MSGFLKCPLCHCTTFDSATTIVPRSFCTQHAAPAAPSVPACRKRIVCKSSNQGRISHCRSHRIPSRRAFEPPRHVSVVAWWHVENLGWIGLCVDGGRVLAGGWGVGAGGRDLFLPKMGGSSARDLPGSTERAFRRTGVRANIYPPGTRVR